MAPTVLQRYGQGLPGTAGDLQIYRGWAAEDGSCFFHTMASALNINDWHAQNNHTRVRIGRLLRTRINTLLTDAKWRDQWRRTLQRDGMLRFMDRVPPAQEIRTKLSNPREWADIFLIEWLMNELDIGCIFFNQNDGCRMYCGARGNKDARTFVLILWVNNVHFEPLYALEEKHDGSFEMHTSFDRNHPMVIRLLGVYDTAQCPGAKVALPL